MNYNRETGNKDNKGGHDHGGKKCGGHDHNPNNNTAQDSRRKLMEVNHAVNAEAIDDKRDQNKKEKIKKEFFIFLKLVKI